MAQTPNFNKLVLLRGFSNYFDRKIFYYDNLSDYLTAVGTDNYYYQTDINFNPNDGITTTVDLSSLDSSYDEVIDIHTFSYCLGLDTDDEIVSRWFVMEIVRQLNGIYRVTLRRDVVAESVGNTTFIGEAPIYIQKGMLEDTDPMIVNDEKMVFNQIKKREIILSYKDSGTVQNLGNTWEHVGFIVGYFANNAPEINASVSAQANPTKYVTISDISTATGISAAVLQQMIQTFAPVVSGDFTLTYGTFNGALSYFRGISVIPQSFSDNPDDYGTIANFAFAWTNYVASGIWWHNIETFAYAFTEYLVTNHTLLRAAFEACLQNDFPTEEIVTQAQLAALNQFQGKILYDSGSYYKITNIQSLGKEPHAEVVITKGESTVIDNTVTHAVSETSGATQTAAWDVYLNYQYDKIKINLEKESVSQGISSTIKTSHNTLLDAPYSMFIIPYGAVDYLLDHLGNLPADTWTMTMKEALALANDIALKMDAHLYDLQLLPFAPEMEQYCEFVQDNTINLKGMINTTDFSYVYRDDPTTPIGAIIFPKTSGYSFSMNYSLELEHSMKIDSQCCFYRLCSPNYNGIFEFNLAKNGGKVLSFYADCTFKPFNPFIRVTPQFDFLYGSNFKDGRGLICGGDFSLPLLKDRWYEYELNNKNYSTIFAREIQNLDVTFNQERIKEGIAIGAGVVGAGAGGAATGFKMGGIYGALAGTAVGSATAAVGGMMDAQLNEALRQEQRRFAMDRFNLSLGNIKALPQSLTRVSSYSVISKIFPFLEFYTCTDEEIEAFKQKIKYDGMTVGRIGVLSSYMGGNSNLKYVKGDLIRAEGITEDDHYIKTLYEEIAKGVYI